MGVDHRAFREKWDRYEAAIITFREFVERSRRVLVVPREMEERLDTEMELNREGVCRLKELVEKLGPGHVIPDELAVMIEREEHKLWTGMDAFDQELLKLLSLKRDADHVILKRMARLIPAANREAILGDLLETRAKLRRAGISEARINWRHTYPDLAWCGLLRLGGWFVSLAASEFVKTWVKGVVGKQ